MYLILTLVGVIPLLVAAQVIRLGLVDDDELRKRGKSQSEAEIVIPALRGSILDARGRILASDTMTDKIILDPTVSGFSANRQLYYQALATASGISVAELSSKIRNRKSDQYLVLARDLTLPSDVAASVNEIPGARVVREFSRNYNYEKTASHIRGYVDVDMKGLEGIEKQYDKYLAGTAGRRAAIKDRRGFRKMLPGGRTIEAQHGESVKLTIDIVRQTIMEEELARGASKTGAKWAVAIAVDPFTGAIQGMANVPTFDINRPAAVPTEFRKNAAIVNQFEPGSTFKLIAAVAAVETGVVAMTDTFHTGNGYARIAGWPVSDTHGYGSIPFAEVISHSSNIGFAQLSLRLDRSLFYQYARAFGFGQKSGIDLPGEVAGSLKRPNIWSGSTASSMSRGYGVDVTALQILMAYSALANGGILVKPHLVAERFDHSGASTWSVQTASVRRVFSRETAGILMPAFEQVILNGTAEKAQVDGIRVAGKTGTAKKVLNGKYIPGKYRASFVGFFPIDDPKIAMIVLMDEPKSSIYGGQTAAPVFRRIVNRWMATMPDVHRTRPEEMFADDARGQRDADKNQPVVESFELPTVPDVYNLPYGVADRRIGAVDLTTASAGRIDPEGFVTQQIPAAGTVVSRGDRVRITMGAMPVGLEVGAVPDVTGMGARDAAAVLASHGFKAQFNGSGRVIRQSARKVAAAGSEIILTLR